MTNPAYVNESQIVIGTPDSLDVLELEVEPSNLKTVVPVIYIPGLFGTRLEKTDGTYLWDPDSPLTLVDYYAKGFLSGFFRRSWNDEEINKKVLLFKADGRVMDDYGGFSRWNLLRKLRSSTAVEQLKLVTDENDTRKLAEEEYARRQGRGWFGPLSDYHALLEQINETDDDHFIFRAYAFGYNWRQDLADSAKALVERLKAIRGIDEYPDLGRRNFEYGAVHDKVIIITHSQGSILARYASEVLGASEHIQGIIHMNQPTTGAPILFRRFIAGSGDERTVPFSLPRISENAFAEILGTSSYHFTCLASEMVGALQLLPTNDYDATPTAIPSWLEADPALVHGLQGKPIEAFYLSDQIGLVCHKRYGADGTPQPYGSAEFPEPDPWPEDPEDAFNPYPYGTPYQQDNMRLRPNGAMTKSETEKAADYWGHFEKRIKTACGFHDELKLRKHENTRVVRSTTLPTVNRVSLALDAQGTLQCPYQRNTEGDGTVPLVSQEALLREGAQPTGDVITGKKAVHADIVKHPQAIEQALAAIRHELVAALRPQQQECKG